MKYSYVPSSLSEPLHDKLRLTPGSPANHRTIEENSADIPLEDRIGEHLIQVAKVEQQSMEIIMDVAMENAERVLQLHDLEDIFCDLRQITRQLETELRERLNIIVVDQGVNTALQTARSSETLKFLNKKELAIDNSLTSLNQVLRRLGRIQNEVKELVANAILSA